MFHFFMRFGCGDGFCTNRRRYGQKPLHRATFSRRYSDILTQRGLCTKKLLHTVCTVVFTQRRTYLQTDALYKDALLARINKGTYRRFTHRNFSTEKPLHRTVFTHVFSTPKTFDTEKLVHTDCTQKFLQTDFFCTQKLHPEQFFHSNFFAQKPLRAKKIRTAVFTDKRFLQTENSPHRSLTHRRFYAQHF